MSYMNISVNDSETNASMEADIWAYSDSRLTTADFTSSMAVLRVFGIANPNHSYEVEFNEELIRCYNLNYVHPLLDQSFDYDIDYIKAAYAEFMRILSSTTQPSPNDFPVTAESGFKFFIDNYYDADSVGTLKLYIRGGLTVEEKRRYDLLPLKEDKVDSVNHNWIGVYGREEK